MPAPAASCRPLLSPCARAVRVRALKVLLLTLTVTSLLALLVLLQQAQSRGRRTGPRARRTVTPAPLPPSLLGTSLRLPHSRSHSRSDSSANSRAVSGSNSSQAVSQDGRFFLTVVPRGRLGNQMFQYASLLGIADVNRRAPFVTSACKVTHYFANVSVSDRPVSGWTTVEEVSYAEKDVTMDYLPAKNLRLKGFLQSWKYFAGIQQKVKRAFVFIPDVQQAVRQFFAQSTRDVTGDVIKIGVHVRRTDMLQRMTQKQGYVAAPLSYLRSAFRHMRGRYGNRSTFFVVSDDPDWCRENLREKSVLVVDPAPSVVHLGFLTLCDHVIMTVGTFGWWAAFLSGGHVTYYGGFPRAGSEIAGGFRKEDFYLPHWVSLRD